MQKLTRDEIKYKFYSHEKLTRDEIEYLIQEVERYEKSLKTIITLTNCDDTWDFANRTLEGKEKTNLPYRFNQI